MDLDLAYFKKRLEKREEQLLDDIERKQKEAREHTDRETGDAMDLAANLEGEEELLRQVDAEYRELEEVREALQRIEDGKFGKCVECGKPIPLGRLEAIPWAKYCVEHQRLHDSELGDGHSLTM
jgi:DnaK suppressor protein